MVADCDVLLVVEAICDAQLVDGDRMPHFPSRIRDTFKFTSQESPYTLTG